MRVFCSRKTRGPHLWPVLFVRQEGRSSHGTGGTVDAGGLRCREASSCAKEERFVTELNLFCLSK